MFIRPSLDVLYFDLFILLLAVICPIVLTTFIVTLSELFASICFFFSSRNLIRPPILICLSYVCTDPSPVVLPRLYVDPFRDLAPLC